MQNAISDVIFFIFTQCPVFGRDVVFSTDQVKISFKIENYEND
jgi:hypothetical protein